LPADADGAGNRRGVLALTTPAGAARDRRGSSADANGVSNRRGLLVPTTAAERAGNSASAGADGSGNCRSVPMPTTPASATTSLSRQACQTQPQLEARAVVYRLPQQNNEPARRRGSRPAAHLPKLLAGGGRPAGSAAREGRPLRTPTRRTKAGPAGRRARARSRTRSRVRTLACLGVLALLHAHALAHARSRALACPRFRTRTLLHVPVRAPLACCARPHAYACHERLLSLSLRALAQLRVCASNSRRQFVSTQTQVISRKR